MRYEDLLYRALNPISACNPLSAEGARIHGGRFNPDGKPALYTSQSVMTAIRETNQIRTPPPTTLVAHEADIGPILDAADPAEPAKRGVTEADTAADDWRTRMLADGKAPTQALAERLVSDRDVGMQVRSFASGSTAADPNPVLWVWTSALPARPRLACDERRPG